MEKIIAQVFSIKRKLTSEEFASLERYNIIDAGGNPDSDWGYFYHFHLPHVEDIETNLSEFDLTFVETRKYEFERRFPIYQYQKTS